jgi:hypothetical protein
LGFARPGICATGNGARRHRCGASHLEVVDALRHSVIPHELT